MIFNNIKPKDYLTINKLLENTQYNGCEYSKLYQSVWDYFNYRTMEFAVQDGMAFLRFKPNESYFKDGVPSKYLYFSPITNIDKIAVGFEMIKAQSVLDDDKMVVINIPQEYVELLDENEYSFKENINYAEYLYLPENLIELKGKKYHQKRNHIANFDKKYQYEFRNYEASDLPQIKQLFMGWLDSKTDVKNSPISEESAIETELKMIDCIGGKVFADVLIVDDKIVAFSLGEISPSNVGIVHLEKGDTNYEGVYSKINNLFAKKHFEKVRLINRQEDMGIEGLRKSKMSYNPTFFCKKITATLNVDSCT